MNVRYGGDEMADDNVEAGLYTWDIPANIFYADAAVAQLFGLDPMKTTSGLPLERYIERVHKDDRALVVASLRRAIVLDEPFQENYRVCGDDGTLTYIMSFGRVFRDRVGDPCRYAGIVFPMPIDDQSDNKLLWHCLCAYDLARTAGRQDVAQQVRSVLMNLDWDATEFDRLP